MMEGTFTSAFVSNANGWSNAVLGSALTGAYVTDARGNLMPLFENPVLFPKLPKKPKTNHFVGHCRTMLRCGHYSVIHKDTKRHRDKHLCPQCKISVPVWKFGEIAPWQRPKDLHPDVTWGYCRRCEQLHSEPFTS